MTTTSEYLVSLAVLSTVIAYAIYGYAIYKRVASPSLFSWFLWASTSVALYIGNRNVPESADSLILQYQSMIFALGSTLIFIVSFWKGEKNLGTTTEKWLTGGVAISIIVWLTWDSPLAALIINLTINCLAAIPTIQEAYRKPGSQGFWGWVFFELGVCFNLASFLTSGKVSLETAFYPVGVFLTITTITLVALTRRAPKMKFKKIPINF